MISTCFRIENLWGNCFKRGLHHLTPNTAEYVWYSPGLLWDAVKIVIQVRYITVGLAGTLTAWNEKRVDNITAISAMTLHVWTLVAVHGQTIWLNILSEQSHISCFYTYFCTLDRLNLSLLINHTSLYWPFIFFYLKTKLFITARAWRTCRDACRDS